MKYIGEIQRKYVEMSGVARLTFWIVLAAQIPLLYLLLNRLFPEFEIDRAPYAMLHVIERVRIGQPIYVPLTPEGASLTYMPFYMWLCGMIWKVFGASLFWPRFVSLVSSLLFAVGVGAFTWRNTKGHLLLSTAAGSLAILTYTWDQPWPLTMIVDPLQIALAIWGFYLLQPELTVRRVVAAAVLLSLSFLTKQTSLAYVVAAGFFIFLLNPRYAFLFLGTAGLLGGGVMYYVNQTSHGEFLLQSFQSAGAAPWIAQRIWDEVLFPDMLGRLGILSLLTLWFVVTTWRGGWRSLLRPDFVMLGASVAVMLIAQPKLGSGMSQALLAYGSLAICGASCLSRLIDDLPERRGERLAGAAIMLQVIVLLLPLISGYRYFIIDQYDREKYRQISSIYRGGRTCFLYFAYLPKLFMQPEHGPFGEERSIWKNGQIDYSNKPDSINKPFYDQTFDYVILGVYAPQEDPTVKAILANYKPVGKLPQHPRGVRGGNMRYEHYVLQANRLHPVPPEAKP